jgi:hypothetical protein
MAIMKIGRRIEKTMGIRRLGTIIAPFNWRECTDGQYRQPTRLDGRIVWVQWDDGTKGWIHESFVLN